MSSPSTEQPTSDRRLAHRFRTDHPRVSSAFNALLWLGLIVLAVAPFPWVW
jgi:hypothetical protein